MSDPINRRSFFRHGLRRFIESVTQEAPPTPADKHPLLTPPAPRQRPTGTIACSSDGGVGATASQPAQPLDPPDPM